LKGDLQQISLEKTMLVEENKLLGATKEILPKQVSQERMIPASRVSHVLSEFDGLLAAQSREIAQLMDDRDKLCTVCFSSLGVINRQDLLLGKLKSSLKRMSELDRNGESFEAVNHDMAALGFDLSAVLSTNRMESEGISELVGAQNIDSDEVVRIINEMAGLRLDSDSQQTVTAFVLQQASEIKSLTETVASEKAKRQQTKGKLASLVNAIMADQRVTMRQVIAEINQLKRCAAKLDEVAAMNQRIVEIFEQFGGRFPNVPDTERCLTRIRYWMQNRNSEVDVCQEIDFLLGMVLPGEGGGGSDEDSGSSEIPAPKNDRIETDMVRQLRQLKQTVCEMKEQSRASEEERRTFISRNLKHRLASSARWPQICEYILSHK
jgi:hypothetical protein